METIVFRVNSMTCKDCENVLERAALSIKGTQMAKSYYEQGILVVSFEAPCNKKKLCHAVEAAGHTLTVEKEKPKEHIITFVVTILLLVLCKIVGFSGKFGHMEVLEESASYFMVFVFGVLTSLHCLSMCGGFILAQNCSLEVQNEKVWSKSLKYHAGRLVGYTAAGAILGLVGSMLAINNTVRIAIGILSGIVMVLMALNIFFNLQFLRRISIRLPQSMRKVFFRLGACGSFAAGIVTAFMPCGSMQSVQIYAIAQGSLLGGALVMAVFCLGTIPLLMGVGVFISYLKVQWRKWITLGSASVMFLLGAFLINNCFAKL